ncbi:PK beta-barrel-protein domain-containing protein-like protein [Annulohypoxylon maeteangense]|uniref:PK beta-barrel-protein domain-containing protein-like protein n=1 Tax=Annulohypoxylon maeteangense TaxID=1927788 RepID=UPI0020081D8D|nr:PK beta-barrel-protein domain-containing protein-like protein [Annulohypoxylon maeteangense]KAI0886992.1 PK beta-barrel-protein domain-containing protein-like protein [Annulohypoxylon maeteangense]
MGSQVTGFEPGLAPLPPKDVIVGLRTGRIRPFGGVKGLFSAINKQPRRDKIQLSVGGFSGDERQYIHHKSPDNAIHQYDPRHYEDWKRVLPDREHKFKVGAFGENISSAHLSENNLCVGDKFRLGPEAIVQITMFRQPCYKLNHRFEYKKMSNLIQSTGYTGWYYRVIQGGEVQEGDEIELIERINPFWSLSRIQHIMYTETDNIEAITEIIQLEGLSKEFLTLFQDRLTKGTENMNGRLLGNFAVPWQQFKLVEKTRLTPRVQRFVFESEDQDTESEDLRFGRFPHVRLKFGPDSKFTRAYSVVSGDMKSFELGIAKDDNSRGGSQFLHDDLDIGDVLEVAKGHNANIPIISNDQDAGPTKHIFVLGGIGVTAFISEIKTLEKKSANFEIHYAVRSRKEAAYLDHLPMKNTTVYAKDEGRRLDVAAIIPPPKDCRDDCFKSLVYCCGPPSLLISCQDITTKLGYPRSQLHFEEFGSIGTGTGEPFEAEIKNTGQILKVPREKSLLDILNEAGFGIDSSCLAGNCGTCMVDVCKGNVIHRGTALEDEQKESSMLSCVSRGKGRIVINC